MVETNFIQKKKNQRNLLFILAIVVIVIIFVVYNGFFKTGSILEEITDINIFVPKQEIKINFNVLNDPVLKGLQPFLEIQSLELATGTEIGRENPFSPF